MAIAEYNCVHCGLVQEKFFRKQIPDTISCASCTKDAQRQISNFGFAFESGKTPGNSGVDSLDSEIDHHVGRDAYTRWERVKDRQSEKQKALAESGGVGVQLKSDGAYAPMSKDEVRRFQKLHTQHQELQKEPKKDSG